MSFSLGDAAPLAPPPLDFATLLSLPGIATGVAITPVPIRYLGGSWSHCLATVLLGRPGWRDAALALGGRFDAEARQPL